MTESDTAIDQYLHAIHALQRRAIESGVTPPILVSLNVDGGAEHNQALLDTWRPSTIHF